MIVSVRCCSVTVCSICHCFGYMWFLIPGSWMQRQSLLICQIWSDVFVSGESKMYDLSHGTCTSSMTILYMKVRHSCLCYSWRVGKQCLWRRPVTKLVVNSPWLLSMLHFAGFAPTCWCLAWGRITDDGSMDPSTCPKWSPISQTMARHTLTQCGFVVFGSVALTQQNDCNQLRSNQLRTTSSLNL